LRRTKRQLWLEGQRVDDVTIRRFPEKVIPKFR